MQLAQSCHAATQFCLSHPDEAIQWFDTSNNLVVLQVKHEAHLLDWALTLKELGAITSSFYEPDLDDELTAVAVAPSPQVEQAVSSLPLAGKVMAGSG